MSATTLIAFTTISAVLEILPIFCHRLITNPYPDNEWDSVIVSSDPIKIIERKHNHTSEYKSKRALTIQRRSFNDCPENDFKCLYGNNDDKANNQIVDRFLERYSNIADVKYGGGEQATGEEGKENEGPRQSYWSMINSQTHHHPYDDKNGWVTLDPVPWSSSKISKWHPTKVGHQDNSNRPWGYEHSTERPVQQFWVSGSSFQTQRPTTQWGLGTNDLITDSRPGDFPTGSYGGYGNHNQGSNYRPQNGLYEYQGNHKEFQQNQGFQGNQGPHHHQNHPSTYPNHGNGEWVLLSTTKGYYLPQKHKWEGKADYSKNEQRFVTSRKIKPIEISKYHEEDLNEKFVLADENQTGNRKSDGNVHDKEDAIQEETTGKNYTKEWETSEKPLEILYTGSSKAEEPVKTFRRKVRLQVLPSLETTSTSYGGLLEVDSSSQTVDESQQEEEKMKKLQTIANVKKNKFRGYKLIPTNKLRGKGMSNKSAVTLAAVGAGMIPATMAILVPMALGRRKRSVTNGHVGMQPFKHGMREW